MSGDEKDEKEFVGTDGKLVKLRHSSSITNTPWYVDQSTNSSTTSNYAQKRDVYKDYDPETYKEVIQSFSKKSKQKKRRKGVQKIPEAPIYDSYSRTTQVESKRDRNDTAHYLKDLNVVGEELEFEDPHELQEGLDGPIQPRENIDAGGGAGALQDSGAPPGIDDNPQSA